MGLVVWGIWRFSRRLIDEVRSSQTDFQWQWQQSQSQLTHQMAENWSKTTSTVAHMTSRLASLDQASQGILGLSKQLFDLNRLLHDKRARGAVGEIQLRHLIGDMIPASRYTWQATLPNQTRADCILHLPEPVGNLVIDSKFPLENFQRAQDVELPETEREAAFKRFRQDIRRHIQEVAKKYILPPHTTNGVLLFIPAESVFALIHGEMPDVVTWAHGLSVWLASPSTLMALLTTIQSILRDHGMREDLVAFQDALKGLGKDMERLQNRALVWQGRFEQLQREQQQLFLSLDKVCQHFSRLQRFEKEGVEEGQSND